MSGLTELIHDTPRGFIGFRQNGVCLGFVNGTKIVSVLARTTIDPVSNADRIDPTATVIHTAGGPNQFVVGLPVEVVMAAVDAEMLLIFPPRLSVPPRQNRGYQ